MQWDITFVLGFIYSTVYTLSMHALCLVKITKQDRIQLDSISFIFFHSEFDACSAVSPASAIISFNHCCQQISHQVCNKRLVELPCFFTRCAPIWGEKNESSGKVFLALEKFLGTSPNHRMRYLFHNFPRWICCRHTGIGTCLRMLCMRHHSCRAYLHTRWKEYKFFKLQSNIWD